VLLLSEAFSLPLNFLINDVTTLLFGLAFFLSIDKVGFQWDDWTLDRPIRLLPLA